MLFELRKIFDDNGHLTVSDAYGLQQGTSATTGYRKLLSLWDKQISALLSDSLQPFELASLLDLPAFIRLLGVMLIGIWIVLVLFLAGLTLIAFGWYDIVTGQHISEIWIALLTSIGGPLGAYIACRVTAVMRDLSRQVHSHCLGAIDGIAQGSLQRQIGSNTETPHYNFFNQNCEVPWNGDLK